MDLREAWEKASNLTEIIRWRKSSLATFGNTVLNYAFLGESTVNAGDTVQRKGKVLVHKPLILLPGNIPQFEGFDFVEELGIDPSELARFLLIRGISFPSLKFHNETDSLDVIEKPMDNAIDAVLDHLDSQNNHDTGVLVGPEDCWQLSVLFYAGELMSRSAPGDVHRLFGGNN